MTRAKPTEGSEGEPDDELPIPVGLMEASLTSPAYAVPKAGTTGSHEIDVGWFYEDVYLKALDHPEVRAALAVAAPMYIENFIKSLQQDNPPPPTNLP